MGLWVLLIIILLGGPVVGVIILAVVQSKQSRRIQSLEKQVRDLQRQQPGDVVVSPVQGATASVDQTETTHDATSNAVPVQAEPVQEQEVKLVEPTGSRVEQPLHDLQRQSQSHSTVSKASEPRINKREMPAWTKDLFTIESIITKLGILMLLIGIGYIFKLAYDNGYITEQIAVLIGVAIGGVLMYLGYISSKKGRSVLSQVLMGGGIAVFYISIYAAYQGYGLINGITAFILMCVVTSAGFITALITDSMAMSVIAILGGLLTPFVLQLEQLGLFGTGSYIFFIAVFAMAVYVFKRWRSLQIVSIIGTYSVTTLFITMDGMSVGERGQLALLMVLLMVIFVGVEYVLAMSEKSSSRFPAITYGIIAALPMITTLQVWNTLEVGENTWTVLFLVAAAVYLALFYLLLRVKKAPVVENITAAVLAAFLLMAAANALGGDIRPVGIVVLAVIYYVLYRKIPSKTILWIGHVLFVISYVMALFRFLDHMFDYNVMVGGLSEAVSLNQFLFRTLTGILFVIVTYLNHGQVRKAFGIITFQIYMLAVVMFQVFGSMENADSVLTASVLILVYGLILWLIHLLNRKWYCVPDWTVPVLVFGPLFGKILWSIGNILFEEGDLEPWLALAYLVFAAAMYLMVHLKGMSFGRLIRLTTKIGLYCFLILTLLVDLSHMTNSLGIGLVAVAGLIFGLQFIEADRSEKSLSLFIFGTRTGWFGLVVIYALATFGRADFDWQNLLIDGGLLIMVFLHMKYYEKKIQMHHMAGAMGILFMVLIYSNLENTDQGSGIVTLGWAAYAIGLLAYSVKKAEKKMIHLAMGFIVLVAGKIVLVDLASVTTTWKIIVSMAFGTALLILSYFLQPILKGQS